MIKIERGEEPAALRDARDARLAALAPSGTRPERTPWFSQGYRLARRDLHARQYYKCCYCEQIQIPLHNDVEHYRPWSLYWWLAWDWTNLLFACGACNRKGGKQDSFPLFPGSVPLAFGERPPGSEIPELLDPSLDDPRDHIRFERDPNGKWGPIGTSWRGQITLQVIGLRRDEFRDLFNRHVESVIQPVVQDLREANLTRSRGEFEVFWQRKCLELLDPARPFRALSEDVLRQEFPSFPAPPPAVAMSP